MQLNPEELQYIVNAIDTQIRTNGLSAATIGVRIVGKIQADAEEEARKTSSESKED